MRTETDWTLSPLADVDATSLSRDNKPFIPQDSDGLLDCHPRNAVALG
ncbi:hypothetical protein NONI108955_02990 [Nocardia ninae]